MRGLREAAVSVLALKSAIDATHAMLCSWMILLSTSLVFLIPVVVLVSFSSFETACRTSRGDAHLCRAQGLLAQVF